jgi:hypothetical protein
MNSKNNYKRPGTANPTTSVNKNQVNNNHTLQSKIYNTDKNDINKLASKNYNVA